jgi:EpsI family protein
MLLRASVVMMVLIASSAMLARASNEEVALRATLDDLRMSFGGWTGRPAARFDAKTMELLGVDQYVHRVYYSAKRQPVFLYVGFYGRQSQGDTMHSPLNCLPGSGWEPLSRSRATLDVTGADGVARSVEVNEVVIQRGAERQVVLYWYQSRSRVTASEYWSKVMTVSDAIQLNRTDGAIVRVIAPFSQDPRDALAQTKSFVKVLFPELQRQLPF